jgi:hypothetical protein
MTPDPILSCPMLQVQKLKSTERQRQGESMVVPFEGNGRNYLLFPGQTPTAPLSPRQDIYFALVLGLKNTNVGSKSYS